MSLDNIQLPTVVIQDLYKKSLVLSNAPIVENATLSTVTAPLSILGNNAQRILILVADNKTLYLPDEELVFLTGILSACKLTLRDVAIINVNRNNDVSHISLTKELKSEKVLLFGVEPSTISLPLQLSTYVIQPYNNQLYIASPSLVILKNDKIEKTKLWHSLKQLFSI